MEPPETQMMIDFVRNLIALPFESTNGLFGAVAIIPIIFIILKKIQKAGN
jgi:hypothetical protein